MSESAIDWDLPEPFTIDLQVKPEHIDRYGHTNNAVYLSWCEDVAWAHSEAVGLAWADYEELKRAMAVRSTTADYLAPSFAGDRVRVGNWIVHVDRIRATRRYQICRVDDATTLVRAECRFVCIDLVSGKPRRLPPEFAERYVVIPAVADALARLAKS